MLDRRAARAQVAADAAGEEIALDELGAGRGRRGAAGADAGLRALPRRRRAPRRAPRGRAGRALPLRAAPAALRRAPLEDAEPPTTRPCSGRRSAAAARRRRSTCPPRYAARRAGERLAVLRALLRRGAFSFDEAVRGADRMTVAVTLFALLELYKRGEADWEQGVRSARSPCGPSRRRDAGGGVIELERRRGAAVPLARPRAGRELAEAA